MHKLNFMIFRKYSEEQLLGFFHVYEGNFKFVNSDGIRRQLKHWSS